MASPKKAHAAAMEKALVSVPTRDAKLIFSDDGLWLVLNTEREKRDDLFVGGRLQPEGQRRH